MLITAYYMAVRPQPLVDGRAAAGAARRGATTRAT